MDAIFTGAMVVSVRDRERPFALPVQVFARRVPIGVPPCRVCGQPHYPDIRRSLASEEHDQGQLRDDICGRCQRLRYQRLDLMAAERARP